MLSEPVLLPILPASSDRPAVYAGGDVLTHADLAQRTDDVAAAIGGVRRLVLIEARNDLDSLTAYLGALRAGHAVLLTDNAAHHAGYDPDVVIAGGRIDSRRPEPAAPLHPDLALLLSTSGSTGSPKLVRLSHENLASNAAAIAQYLGLTPADRAMTSLPMHYCYGLSVINSHLAAGAAVVLTDLSVVDRCFWTQFHAAEATSLAGVPYTFELLDRIGFDPRRHPSLRFMTQAGGRMDPERVRRYAELTGNRLFVMYGQTEATARMAYLPPHLAASNPDCIGIPIPGGEFDIADGELVFRGPNVMLGYAHTRADLALGRTVDALSTGDLAERTPDGLYRIVGRRSRVAKLYGLRIDLDHLERAHGAVVAGDDAGLVVASARPLDVSLPRSAVHTVDPAAVPRLPNGKPDYAALLAMRPAATTTGATATTPNDVAALFSRVLGCEVHDDDTFVGLGGDSLSYVETSVALERLLGDLPPNWHTTPVGELRRTRPARLARMEANVVVRAVAIVLVVASHTDWFEFEGGAHILLAVAGFNFARFQRVTGRMWRSIARVAVPSMCVIGAMATLRDDFAWPHALLVNGILGDAEARWAYWYIEALVGILVGLALLFSSRRIRAFERRQPAAFAALILAAGLAVRLLPDPSHRIARPQELVWLFALGWAAALSSQKRQRLLLAVIAIAATHGFFGEPDRELVVMLGTIALIWLPTVRVPRPLTGPIAVIAAASLYIYLAHWAVYPWLLAHTPAAVATLGSLAVGVAAHRLADRDVRHTLLTFARPRHTDVV